jgi:hypothetical protein
MTVTHNITPATTDPIAAHRYVRPISSVAAAPRHKMRTSRLLTAGGDLERVVSAAAAGDETAVAELVDRFAVRIRAVARAHRLDTHDVEDVMQTTCLRLLQCVDTIRNPSAIGAWLETTARRESLRVLKTNIDAVQRPHPTLRRSLSRAWHPDRKHRPDPCTCPQAPTSEPEPSHSGGRVLVAMTTPAVRMTMSCSPVKEGWSFGQGRSVESTVFRMACLCGIRSAGSIGTPGSVTSRARAQGRSPRRWSHAPCGLHERLTTHPVIRPSRRQHRRA